MCACTSCQQLNCAHRCTQEAAAVLRSSSSCEALLSVVVGVQLHAIVLAMFASIIAPFGGFFASGFKRSFKIKDFGDSIPGHGGMTDRMDCQVSPAVISSAVPACVHALHIFGGI